MVAFSPTFMVMTPSSQARITWSKEGRVRGKTREGRRDCVRQTMWVPGQATKEEGRHAVVKEGA
jgi:hypothetical protein